MASLANSIGLPLRFDSHNIHRDKLGVASVSVELDISKSLVTETWDKADPKTYVPNPYPPHSKFGKATSTLASTGSMDTENSHTSVKPGVSFQAKRSIIFEPPTYRVVIMTPLKIVNSVSTSNNFAALSYLEEKQEEEPHIDALVLPSTFVESLNEFHKPVIIHSALSSPSPRSPFSLMMRLMLQ
ncbi:hypothetical protein LIER_38904 [Lithospermum erythrorhizon]|uniref:Uncharacterized protein n=1 Tax=Lithospermum erythrorhizon TaxID=34254 RepID=A0AAV3Q892_LITER